MSLIDDLENGVDNAWHDISTTGAPAVIAGVENYASEELKKQAVQNQAASQAAVNAAVQSGGASTGVMASINKTMHEIAQGAVFKNYGLYIVAGLVIVMIAGRKML